MTGNYAFIRDHPRRPRPLLGRIVGAVTVAYSVVLVSWPRLLAGPAGMSQAGAVATPVATGIRAIGTRDTIIGTAMIVAPPGRALAGLCTLRAVVDLTDAALFGSQLPSPAARWKIGGFAAGWAALSAVAAVRAAGTHRPRG
jgi:hypothetical protein